MNDMENFLRGPRKPDDRHLSEYRTFFARYDLVASANYCLSWAPSGLSEGYQCVRAFTKTPFECLVGLKLSLRGKSSIEHVRSYDVRKDAFISSKFSEISDQEKAVLVDVEEFLTENGLPPVEIGILSETSRGHGFGFSGTFATALSSALLEYAGRAPSPEVGFSETSPVFA